MHFPIFITNSFSAPKIHYIMFLINYNSFPVYIIKVMFLIHSPNIRSDVMFANFCQQHRFSGVWSFSSVRGDEWPATRLSKANECC